MTRCSGCGKERKQTSLLTCTSCGVKSYCQLRGEICVDTHGGTEPFKCLECCSRDGTQFKHTLLRDRSLLPDVPTVVLCLWYLPAKITEAQGFQNSIESILELKGYDVIIHFAPLGDIFLDDGLLDFLDTAFIPDGSLLLICILTEGTASRGGGLWWFEEPHKQYHETLSKMYKDIFIEEVMKTMITKFKRRTVIQLACGIGLDEGDVGRLHDWMKRTDVVDEIIIPTRLAFHPAQLLGFTVSLVVLLYNRGKDPDASIIEAWLRDERSREHSDLLVLRARRPIESLIWSPNNRPFGRYLVRCGCDGYDNPRWRFVFKKQEENLFSSHYKCTGCKAKLRFDLRVEDCFTRIESLGTTYVRCPWPVPHITTTQLTTRHSGLPRRPLPS